MKTAEKIPASLRVFTRDAAATIDPRLYGSFVEHLGRAVYTGIYEPDHPAADADGLRADVAAAIREIDVPIVRYPGGNFVSCYRWEDGVGPRSERPRRVDLAWHTVETNLFGTHEFMRWCEVVKTAPMMAVNLGTRGIADAVNLVEYCNHPGGTAWSDLRARNGHRDPWNVRVWCLGNEMDGPWQTGHKTAHEYGRLAAETANALRQYDSGLELVLCGSSSRDMPTFMSWERTVLEEAYAKVDYLSLHAYFAETGMPSDEAYLALPLKMDAQIRETIAVCDFVKARGRHKKTMMLSFDEWNVWDSKRHSWDFPAWSVAPGQLEQIYTMKDALVFAGLVLTLMRHAARVHMACLAQLVNVIAPIMTVAGGPVWKQTIFYPYLHASRFGRGILLDTKLASPGYESDDWGRVPYVDALATSDPADGSITLFALNRSTRDAYPLDVALDAGKWEVREHIVLVDDDLEATNSAERPDRIVPRPCGDARVTPEGVSAMLARLSWNVIRLRPLAGA